MSFACFFLYRTTVSLGFHIFDYSESEKRNPSISLHALVALGL